MIVFPAFWQGEALQALPSHSAQAEMWFIGKELRHCENAGKATEGAHSALSDILARAEWIDNSRRL